MKGQKMVITCDACGSDRFKAGELELNLDGSFTVVMPCANCGTPSKQIQDTDPEFAKLLMEFFGHAEDVGDHFSHRLK